MAPAARIFKRKRKRPARLEHPAFDAYPRRRLTGFLFQNITGQPNRMNR